MDGFLNVSYRFTACWARFRVVFVGAAQLNLFTTSFTDNTDGSPRPLYNLNFNMIVKRIKIAGFIVTDLIPKWIADFQKDMIPWITAGKIKAIEDVRGPIDTAPEYFVGMLRGANKGKAVVKVSE